MSDFFKACENGNIGIVKQFTVDINAQDKNGETGLFIASVCGSDEIVELLINSGASVNIKNNRGQTALIAASYFNRAKIVEILLDSNSNIDEQDSQLPSPDTPNG